MYMRTGIRELALIFKINYLGGGEGGGGGAVWVAKSMEQSCRTCLLCFSHFQGVAEDQF